MAAATTGGADGASHRPLRRHVRSDPLRASAHGLRAAAEAQALHEVLLLAGRSAAASRGAAGARRSCVCQMVRAAVAGSAGLHRRRPRDPPPGPLLFDRYAERAASRASAAPLCLLLGMDAFLGMPELAPLARHFRTVPRRRSAAPRMGGADDGPAGRGRSSHRGTAECARVCTARSRDTFWCRRSRSWRSPRPTCEHCSCRGGICAIWCPRRCALSSSAPDAMLSAITDKEAAPARMTKSARSRRAAPAPRRAPARLGNRDARARGAGGDEGSQYQALLTCAADSDVADP